MTGRQCAERLAAAGLDAAEVAPKAHLFETALADLARTAGAPAEHACWVPGRLEVFGTHTDYAGGRTLVSALPRGFACCGRRRAGGGIHLFDSVRRESHRFDPEATAGRAPGWRNYAQVVAGRLTRNFPGALAGADLVVASDLPPAAGMSSSSALMVGIATALVGLFDIRSRPEWQANIRGAVDEAGYYACIENGRTFGSLAGDGGVGTHGGSEDHAAMVCGAAGTLSAYAFVPMRRLETVALPDAWQFVVAASGVAAEKTGPALESYNRLARAAGALLDLWNRGGPPASSLASALADGEAAVARLRDIVREAPADGWTTAALEARLDHFVREDARVLPAVQAFRDGDAASLRRLAEASQRDAERLLRNQVPETSALAALANGLGALAARSFGAGFGGSVWALVPRVDAAAFATAWLDRYSRGHDRPRAAAFQALPGPGVVELATP